MPVRFVLVKLLPGVDRQEYERFIREQDYAVVPATRTIKHFRTHRVESESSTPSTIVWDYVERLEVTERDPYLEEICVHPAFEEYRRRRPQFVESRVGFWASVIEPDAPGTLEG